MKKTVTLILMLSILFMSSTHVTPIVGQMHNSDPQCDNPTATLTIIGSTANNEFKFDKKEYKVDRDTCYTLIFQNVAPAQHDLSIDSDGDDFAAVHLHLDSNTDEGGSVNTTIKTPDKDVTYKIYCSIIGHEDAGMKTDLVVGAGSSKDDSPGFSWFVAIAALSLPVVLLRRRK